MERENNTSVNISDSEIEEIFGVSGNSSDEEFLSVEERRLLEQAIEDAHIEIPLNSKSITVSDTTSRFSSAIWYSRIQAKTVTLAGVGGIGSYIAFLLSRMHIQNLYLYDPDIVESVNMSGQLYSFSDIGMHKVNAISNTLTKYSDFYNVCAINERFTASTPPNKVMICGFDNMEARTIFFNSWKNMLENLPEEVRKDCLFIDGRLAAEEFQIFCIRGDDTYNIDRYAKDFLFKDSEADETICSYKQTTFMANMIASVMVNLFVNFVANQCDPLIERDLPFYTTFNAETMFYKTEA